MTIASAINAITADKGGTPNKGGSIAGAIDALNDALAGSDQPASMTIEAAINKLGENIGSGVTYGYLKPVQVTYDGTPSSADGALVTNETTIENGDIICGLATDEDGLFSIAAGAVLAVFRNDSGQVATLSVDGGEPQPINQVESEDFKMTFHVFRVPNAEESIVVNITDGD